MDSYVPAHYYIVVLLHVKPENDRKGEKRVVFKSVSHCAVEVKDQCHAQWRLLMDIMLAVTETVIKPQHFLSTD